MNVVKHCIVDILFGFCVKSGGNSITNQFINITIHLIQPKWICWFGLKNKNINLVELNICTHLVN